MIIRRQSSIKDYALPKITRVDRDRFQIEMALYFYSTGTSFQRVENLHLAAAMQILRPDMGLLPTRKHLATTLLDKCAAEFHLRVKKCLANSTACLTSDGWTNIKKDSVINYMAVSPSRCLFLESVSTGEQGHDADFLARDIIRVILKHNTTMFAGAITDNTSTNKKMWKILKERFPSKFFHGCTAHGLHLMVKDIFGATKTKKAGPDSIADYPVGYPFEDLKDFVEDCKDVVKFFQNHHIVKAQLEKEQKAAGTCTLVCPALTRWGTIQAMAETLLGSEPQLHGIAMTRDFIVGTAAQKAERIKIRRIVTSNDFVKNLNKAIAILRPIDALIVKYQSDGVPISDVWLDFHLLPNRFTEVLNQHHISGTELEYLVKLSRDCFDFMYGIAHGMAYLLDPLYLGIGLPFQIRKVVEDQLCAMPSEMGISPPPIVDSRVHQEKLFLQYMEFMIDTMAEKDGNTFRYQMLLGRQKTPLQWWLTDGIQWPELQQVAIKLFSMATSSASCERNFSVMGFIHSKLRNSLSPATVEKLVFIKSNIAAFYDHKPDEEAVVCIAADESSSGNEDEHDN